MFSTNRPDYAWLNEEARQFLKASYLVEGETPEQRIRDIGEYAENILGMKGFADKFESYMKRGWMSLASPIWSNFGRERGLPISCNNSHIPDSVEEIADKISEIAIMSKLGAGTSIYLGDIRPRGTPISSGGTADGPVRFAEWFDKTVDIISQGNVRRGQCAAYLPVEHPDIEEFLEIRSEGHPIADLSIGVTITRQWLKEMRQGDVQKQTLWLKIMKKSIESGYPYLMFTDNANDQAPQVYKDKGLKINSSNLCTEILLASDKDSSFVCNLSSLNVVYYNEWKHTDLVKTMIYFLDAVMSEYVRKTKGIKHMEAARNFAKTQRALGLGILGWHTFLQLNELPFDSVDAYRYNGEIAQFMRSQAEQATKELASIFGEPELLKGTGRRNVTLMAIAPTKSSSTILGQVSQGIQYIDDNYHTKKRQNGTVTFKNPVLAMKLKELGMDKPEIWQSILENSGSIAHLDVDQNTKDVFKTSLEIDMRDVVLQTAQRQMHYDQGQSMNVRYKSTTKTVDMSRHMLFAERLGVVTRYYQNGKNVSKEYAQMKAFEDNSCVACEA